MKILDKSGQVVSVGAHVVLSTSERSGPAVFEGSVMALYENPTGITLRLSKAANVYDETLRGLQRRGVGDDIYKHLYGDQLDTTSFRCNALELVEPGAG